MENDEIIASLAHTLELTRTELDALRTLFIGVLAALSDRPEAQRLAKHLRDTIERETAFSLNTQMPDQMLQARSDWMQRLMPPHLARLVWPGE